MLRGIDLLGGILPHLGKFLPRERRRKPGKKYGTSAKYSGPLHSHCPICDKWCKTHDGVCQHIEAKHVVDDVEAA